MSEFSTRTPRRVAAWSGRIPLTREGLFWCIIATGLLLIGLSKGINLITLLGSFLVVLVIWNGWSAYRQLRTVRVERIEDGVAFAQTPYRWAVRLVNSGPRSVSGLCVVEALGSAAQSWFVNDLGAGGSIIFAGEATFPRRGFAHSHALLLKCEHPLGLVRLRRQASSDDSRIVLPRLGRVQRAWLQRLLKQRSQGQAESRPVPSHVSTAQAELHGLRPYRPGDSPRHLHWRTSARRGEPMVREYQDWPSDDLTLVLEARKQPSAGDDSCLELAISFAATICWEWCRQTGDRFMLGIAGTAPTVLEGATGRSFAYRALESLAVEPGAAIIDLDGLIEQLERRKRSAGPILLVSSHESDFGARLQSTLRRPTVCVTVASGLAAPFFEL